MSTLDRLSSTVDDTLSGVDRLSVLRKARDLLISSMSDVRPCGSCGHDMEFPALALPQVVRELRAVLSEIDSIDDSGEVSGLDQRAAQVADELAAARDRRRPAG